MAYKPKQAEAVKALIVDRIVQGESLRTICTDDDMPAASTVFLWLRDDQAFSEQYARAKEAQTEALVEEILDIADDGTNDWMERKNADDQNIGWQENGEALRRSQLRIEARKWLAGKLKPKKYGDKVQVGGDPDNPIDVRVRLDAERFTSAVARISARSGKSGSAKGT